MKVLIGRGSCKVTFEEHENYFGRTLLIEGEGNPAGEFCVYKSSLDKMCWTDPSDTVPNHFVWVDATIRDEVVSYVIEGAKKQGYSLVLW